MTNEEAIKMLSSLAQFLSDGYYDYLANGGKADDSFDNEMMAFDKAIKALEKQIPKKPKRVDHWALCPTCYSKYGFSYDILVGMRGLKTGECHCLNCGQAIDWSDDE